MKKRFSKGFSLVEVAIAISIMVMGVVWVYSSINDMIRISNNATSRLEAGFLATEGMEFIKNKRDDNYVFYLNNISKSPSGCLAGYKESSDLPCNWLYGIKPQGATTPVFYNIDLDSLMSAPVFPQMTVSSKCQNMQIFLNGGDALRPCLGDLYNDSVYQFLVQNKNTGIYSLGNEDQDHKKSIFKRLVVVSPLGPGDIASFQTKYAPDQVICQGRTSAANASKFDSTSNGQIANDIVRIDSIVFWQSAKGIEFIHLATYMFNYHPYYYN